MKSKGNNFADFIHQKCFDEKIDFAMVDIFFLSELIAQVCFFLSPLSVVCVPKKNFTVSSSAESD